ncbi:hypothetical protein [Paludibacterium denitrificans]|uniref:hypothetical protein n=1 Tax=Paludibacterium denitrificans TaxID=2675226 RepID=UPI001E56F729|nr:hypothetical protein [Paludibacterium denitrificans]
MDTITALALSFSLMVAYYGVRKAWKKVTYKPPRQRQIDPVGEAEVFRHTDVSVMPYGS